MFAFVFASVFVGCNCNYVVAVVAAVAAAVAADNYDVADWYMYVWHDYESR